MSMSPQETFDRVAELTDLYLLDELDEAQLAELETLVRSSSAAATAMRTVLKQAGTMRVVFGEQRNFASRIGEVDRNEYLALLQTLSPAQEPEPVHLVGSLDQRQALWQHWQIVIPSAIAALLAIAVTLIITLSGSTPTPNPAPFSNNTSPKPAESVPPILRDQTVATLTAEHNAAWASPQAEGALAPGSQLRAGQRLTLTAGFAEITTNRGAIAILEAPTTIELIDNDNALRLHAGKLVGICETQSSKGFLVRTPQMDIIDLGTRFGVAVGLSGETTTEVFKGSVAVKPTQPTRSGFEQRVLKATDRLTLDAAGLPTTQTVSADLFDRPALMNAGVVSTQGLIRWSANRFTSTDYHDWPKSDEVMLIEELREYRLTQALPVSLTEPKTYTRFNEPSTAQLPPGTVVRTYLVMFNPLTSGPSENAGEIVFDGKILGITAEVDQNEVFLTAIGDQPGLVRGAPNTWMERPKGNINPDQITLREDGKSLSYRFNVQGTCDMFRVIVWEPDANGQGDAP